MIELKGPSLTLLGPYEVSGRILIIPIQGSGHSNITIGEQIREILSDKKWITVALTMYSSYNFSKPRVKNQIHW